MTGAAASGIRPVGIAGTLAMRIVDAVHFPLPSVGRAPSQHRRTMCVGSNAPSSWHGVTRDDDLAKRKAPPGNAPDGALIMLG
ncbi:hypothetical protein GCM10017653_06080 [Ancylobacter defluvii]|uniref:Uncharacterized protein n=2 Tax=Ancylobacter defluvii TaxID=1282440 RepID=A0A9W6N8M9_9HYPH|nr:hypothetical protein GCM10017653_06080 [Ancylobacter defluvii]